MTEQSVLRRKTIMKRVAGVLLASLMLMPICPVYASESITNESTANESATIKDLVPQQIYQLNYADIEKVIMERNPTIKANVARIDSADNGYLAIDDTKGDLAGSSGDIGRMIKALKAQANTDGITPAEKAAIEVKIRGYQAQRASLGNNIETLENSSEDAAQGIEKVKLNIEMTNQQIFSNTENSFFQNDSLKNQRQGLENNIAYLNKKKEAVDIQKTLGMISDLDVSNFDQQLKDLNFQLDTAKQQQETLLGQVNLLIGQDYNHPLELISNPVVDEGQIKDLDYTKDLAKAINMSYALKLQRMEIDAKQLALEHAEEMDGIDTYSYKKAQADIEAENLKLKDVSKKLTQGFDLAYNAIQDKLDASKLEQSRLDNLKTKLSNAQLSNQVGLISNLDLAGIGVEYDGQVLKVKNAQEDLMKAYTAYQWLVKGVGTAQ